jgi:hypothetical protein
MKNKYKNQRKWLIVIMVGLSGAIQASTIVNWGASGGSSTIVTERIAKNSAAGATYGLVTPTDNAGYPLDVPGQTRSIYGASTEAWNNTLVNQDANQANTDYMQLVKNFQGSFNTMLAWESADFLTTDSALETMTVRWESRGGDGSTASFLIKTGAGWYKSDESNLNTSTSVAIEWTLGVADLHWTAFSEFGVTGGTGAADISDIQAAGVYFAASSSTATWTGTKVEYVNVTAIPPTPKIGTVELGAVITLP